VRALLKLSSSQSVSLKNLKIQIQYQSGIWDSHWWRGSKALPTHVPTLLLLPTASMVPTPLPTAQPFPFPQPQPSAAPSRQPSPLPSLMPVDNTAAVGSLRYMILILKKNKKKHTHTHTQKKKDQGKKQK
jgi:hypothetical protein